MARTDILLDDAQELQAVDGDFKTGDASVDHTVYLVESDYGHYKDAPLVGVGIHRYLGAPYTDTDILEGKIIDQMKKDKFRTPRVDASDFNNIKINGIIITQQ